MTSRIPNARDSSGNEVTIEMAERQHYDNLICGGCPAPVEFANGSTRRISGGGGIGTVDPYFRLKRGCSHTKSCPFGLKYELAKIVRSSKRSVVRRLENGGFEFDLLVIRDVLRRSLPSPKSAGSGKAHGSARAQADPAADRNALKPYINDAMKVLRLCARCDSNAEMQAALVLMFAGKRISWDEFYYVHRNYFRCVNYVSDTQGQLPVAVRGWVQYIRRIGTGSDKGATLYLSGLYRPTEREDVVEVAGFSIQANNPKDFGNYAEGQEVLVLGLWDVCDVENSPNSNPDRVVKTYRHHTLWMNLILPVQICPAAVVTRSRGSRQRKPTDIPPRPEGGASLSARSRRQH